MQVYDEALMDVTRYIETHKHIKLEDKALEFEDHLKRLGRYCCLNADSRMIEIGIGTGWFPIMCKKRGLSCCGIEISPQLVAYAKEFGRGNGVDVDLEIANLEETDLGSARYDVVIAFCVFEHIEHWKGCLRKVFEALKPGGVLYFTSTNKFSLRSGEYRFPLYGWLPDPLRYALRKWKQGPDIMKLGIDFNQFTYFQLRRFFGKLGFSRILDRIDLIDPQKLLRLSWLKRTLVRLLRSFPIMKEAGLLFARGTTFICIK